MTIILYKKPLGLITSDYTQHINAFTLPPSKVRLRRSLVLTIIIKGPVMRSPFFTWPIHSRMCSSKLSSPP